MNEKPNELQALKRVRSLAKSGTARAIRVGNGISRTELAREARVSTRSIYRWENGETLPHGPAALRYAAALNSLMDGEQR